MSEKPSENASEKAQEQVQSVVNTVKEEVTVNRRPWYHMGRVARVLFIIYAIQLALFGALAWWAHANPVSPVDVHITREFQENPTSWLHILMAIISYPGSTFLLPVMVLLTALGCWFIGLRLEGVVIAALSIVSSALNVGLKLLVERPRPNAQLVEVFQKATGNSFPSGHVMAYLAFWGLLFSLGIILFRGFRWWRILLLTISAIFVALVGPSRIYLGDHWASDVLGSYLIGGVLLGVTLWIYLKLKERGVLETKRIRHHMDNSNRFRSFPLHQP